MSVLSAAAAQELVYPNLSEAQIDAGLAEAKRVLDQFKQMAREGKTSIAHLAGVSLAYELVVKALSRGSLPTLRDVMQITVEAHTDCILAIQLDYTRRFCESCSTAKPVENVDRDFFLGASYMFMKVQSVVGGVFYTIVVPTS